MTAFVVIALVEARKASPNLEVFIVIWFWVYVTKGRYCSKRKLTIPEEFKFLYSLIENDILYCFVKKFYSSDKHCEKLKRNKYLNFVISFSFARVA
jgi:hypothetical protein